jgi:dephospho-CoA kinase
MSDPDKRPLRIGLTGGIASGKTAVADLFAALGASVIDTDVIARAVVEPGQPGLEAVTSAFGTEILRTDGTLNRAALRAIVFAAPDKKLQLEAILHPLIRAATLAEAGRSSPAAGYQIFVVPLLLESGFIELVDRVLVVDCRTEIQQARLMARDGASAESAMTMIESQVSRDARLAQADDVIENSGTLADLEPAVRALHEQYLQLS